MENFMKNNRILITMVALLLISVADLSAREFRVTQIPNGVVFACSNCHVNPNGGGTLNSFGQEVMKNLDGSGNVEWTAALAELDSDGDGYTNGVELQDPSGEWRRGDANPGNQDEVYLPGDPTSHPTTNSVDIFAELEVNSIAPNPVVDVLRINFTQKTSKPISIDILDITGTVIYEANELSQNGENYFIWNKQDNYGKLVTSGTYIVRFRIEDKFVVRKIHVMN